MDIIPIVDKGIELGGDALTAMLEAYAIAQFPPLGLPVIKQIWEFVFEKAFGGLTLNLEKGANGIIISISNGIDNDAAKKAKEEFKKAQDDPNISKADYAKAREDFKKKYARLIRQRRPTPMP